MSEEREPTDDEVLSWARCPRCLRVVPDEELAGGLCEECEDAETHGEEEDDE